jgi:Uma2 family endonuclease
MVFGAFAYRLHLLPSPRGAGKQEHNWSMIAQLAEDDRPPATLTIEEYYRQVWRPDCDFVDGRSEERNVGTFHHSTIVTTLQWKLSGLQMPRRVLPLPGLRLRVSPTRVRVADVCVLEQNSSAEQVPTHPPVAVFEVLEEEDLFGATMEKLRDYDRFGVPHIWVIDPEPRIAYRYTGSSLEEVHSGELIVPGTPIRVVLSEMFGELDRI